MLPPAKGGANIQGCFVALIANAKQTFLLHCFLLQVFVDFSSLPPLSVPFIPVEFFGAVLYAANDAMRPLDKYEKLLSKDFQDFFSR